MCLSRILVVAVAGAVGCAERPTFSQDQIGDVCYVAEDCGAVDIDTGAGSTYILQGEYVLAPLRFDGGGFACVENQCSLADSQYDAQWEEYDPMHVSYFADHYFTGSGTDLYSLQRYCERDADCSPFSQCAYVLEVQGTGYYESFECRQTCESDAECPSEICGDGVCVAADETVLSASTP